MRARAGNGRLLRLPAPLTARSWVAVGGGVLFALLAPGLHASASIVQDADPLHETLRANRTTLEMTAHGRLTGPGADLLLAEGERSQFFLVAEEHGIAEVPGLTAALFRALQPAGYRHLAVEIGATTADTLEGLARASEPLDAFVEFFAAHAPGTAFFTAREDAEMLIDAVRTTGGAEGTIWGLDYDILADRYPLRRLRDLAPNDEARRAVESAIERADAGLTRAVAESNPMGSVMFSGPDTVFDALVDAFGPDPDPEAARILHTLTETVRINGHFVAGEVWESNERRARLNKERLVDYYREAAAAEDAPPRAVFRFGSYHMMRGRTGTNVYDIGQLAASIADLNGLESFHLLMVGGPNTLRQQFDPRTFGWMHVPVSSITSAGLAPLVPELADGWTLFDLRPLRPRVDRERLGDLDPAFERMIWAFDAVLVLVGSRPGSSLPGAPWLN